MLDQVFNCARTLSRFRSGPFGDLIDTFAGSLQAQGYARATIRSHLRFVWHFGLWFHSQTRSSASPDQDAVRSFLVEHLPKCHCPPPAARSRLHGRPALAQLLKLLRDRGHSPPLTVASTPAVIAVEQFHQHLRDTCGLAHATCRSRVGYALDFLTGKFGHRPIRWEALQPSDIVSFVTGYAQRYRPGSTQVVASSLRSFLRYLQFQGWGTPSLLAAIPRLPRWRLAHLPKTMTDEQLKAFLATFDQTTATGQRDYAMALCQAHLGLRVSEVADLRLEDLDWRAASIRIATRKTGRARELPLPQQVGKAIVTYLRESRPNTAARHVFVRHRRLEGSPVSVALISCVMARAFDKVLGCAHWRGPHVLRHTAATRLHSRGANFKEIADILGHRCLDTTFIYTKIDVPGLSAVALPWPETSP